MAGIGSIPSILLTKADTPLLFPVLETKQTLPFILSEAGVDQNGDPKTSGWAARGSEGDYKNWLSWFNGQINQDSYVLGATLYQIGDNHWSSFNIESIADWISKSL